MQFLLVIWLIIYSSSALADTAQLSVRLAQSESSIKKIEHALSSKVHLTLEELNNLHIEGLKVEEFANECSTTNEKNIDKTADDLELLGPQAVPEDKVITKKRVSLNKIMLAGAQQLASCRLLLLRVKEANLESDKRKQIIIENRLFTQKTTFLDHLQVNLINPNLIFNELKKIIILSLDINELTDHKYILVAIFLFSIVVAFFVKKSLIKTLSKKRNINSLSLGALLQLSLLSCTNHFIPIMLSSSSLAVYLMIVSPQTGLPLFSIFIFGVSFLTLLLWLIRIFFNPCQPAVLFLNIDSEISQHLSNRLRLLSWLLFIGFILYFVIHAHTLNPVVFGLIRNIFIAVVVLNLIWITLIIGRLSILANTTLIRSILILALLIIWGSDWLGYSNLAIFILLGLSFTVLIILMAVFISRLYSDFIDGFDEGRYQWQQATRKMIGLKADDFIPGSLWLRLAGNIIIWSLGIVSALKVWGLSNSSLLEVKTLLIDGFTLGTVQIIPTRILIAIVSFALMLSTVGWVKRRLDKSWLRRSRMDHGSKEAMISLTGYFGLVVAFLVTLSIAGVELANLALIAGALSVGIGFGLQNIVNNFISGVILLFERPIKTGDWIVVGNTEGYVRKISIRSTQIQTFDRSDVLVPNSELISGQLTNWMFKDSRGRLIVPIGVAYGSDVEKVRAILISIAENHPDIIKNSPILSDPFVLFREFANSSLNLELRCFMVDVGNRLSVLSDINFEINRQFALHKIEIPFPQSDVTIKNLPENYKPE